MSNNKQSSVRILPHKIQNIEWVFKFNDDERLYEKNNNGEPNVYVFKIESIGFYSPLKITLMGLDLLITRLNSVKNEFLNNDSKKIIRNIDISNFYSF